MPVKKKLRISLIGVSGTTFMAVEGSVTISQFQCSVYRLLKETVGATENFVPSWSRSPRAGSVSTRSSLCPGRA